MISLLCEALAGSAGRDPRDSPHVAITSADPGMRNGSDILLEDQPEGFAMQIGRLLDDAGLRHRAV